MIIGDHREQVIENIKHAAESGLFNSKVEVDDPVMSDSEKKQLVERYLKQVRRPQFFINNWIARRILWSVTKKENRHTQMIGLDNIRSISGGAIVTSNHFNPLDNTIVREMARRMGKKNLFVVCQETNLAMSGIIGYMMNYIDMIPITSDRSYMTHQFAAMIKKQLDHNHFVLIYPEQEMWFNYRKPRPLKRGAYYYAATFDVPVISCFVEIRTLEELETPEFYRIQYVMHILPPIYPDPEKSIRQNSMEMCQRDYAQKKAAYEQAYGRKLDYTFEPEDIAGWIPTRLDQV